MDEAAATIRATLAQSGYLLDPHTAAAVHVAAGKAERRCADGGARHRASGQVPGCGRSGLRRVARPCPRGLAELDGSRGKVHGTSIRPENGGRLHEPPRAGGALGSTSHMGVEVSRLSNGLTVATETLPSTRIRRPRRLGQVRRPQRARRRARHGASARAHGVQGHRDAHRLRDRLGNRECRRRDQRRHQRRDDRPTTPAC